MFLDITIYQIMMTLMTKMMLSIPRKNIAMLHLSLQVFSNPIAFCISFVYTLLIMLWAISSMDRMHLCERRDPSSILG